MYCICGVGFGSGEASNDSILSLFGRLDEEAGFVRFTPPSTNVTHRDSSELGRLFRTQQELSPEAPCCINPAAWVSVAPPLLPGEEPCPAASAIVPVVGDLYTTIHCDHHRIA